MRKTGFIGAGNMGTAIMSAMIQSEKFHARDIYVYDKVISEKVSSLSVNCAPLKVTVSNSDTILLCTKPNIIPVVSDEIKNECDIKDKLFISIAAGVKLEKLYSYLGTKKVIRVMPNLCLMSGEGMCVLATGDDVEEEEKNEALKIFSSSGKACVVDEKLIDACTALNGSGPAYVFMFIKALADAGMRHGIDEETALLLSTQTVLGGAKTVFESPLSPQELKNMVCSPNGTTIEAVKVLEASGFDKIISDCVDACVKRAIELGKE